MIDSRVILISAAVAVIVIAALLAAYLAGVLGALPSVLAHFGL